LKDGKINSWRYRARLAFAAGAAALACAPIALPDALTVRGAPAAYLRMPHL
jgi:hypothetical protein